MIAAAMPRRRPARAARDELSHLRDRDITADRSQNPRRLHQPSGAAMMMRVSTKQTATGKWQSGAITDGPSRAGARSMLHAAGFDRDALAKPIVGIANTWIEIGPCNLHLRDLAASVKDGV